MKQQNKTENVLDQLDATLAQMRLDRHSEYWRCAVAADRGGRVTAAQIAEAIDAAGLTADQFKRDVADLRLERDLAAQVEQLPGLREQQQAAAQTYTATVEREGMVQRESKAKEAAALQAKERANEAVSGALRTANELADLRRQLDARRLQPAEREARAERQQADRERVNRTARLQERRRELASELAVKTDRHVKPAHPEAHAERVAWLERSIRAVDAELGELGAVEV